MTGGCTRDDRVVIGQLRRGRGEITYPIVEETTGRNGAGGRPTGTGLSGGGPGFALRGGFFADVKATIVLVADGDNLVHCGAELGHDGSEQQCNGTHVNRCLMHAPEQALEMPTVKLRAFSTIYGKKCPRTQKACLISGQKMKTNVQNARIAGETLRLAIASETWINTMLG